MIQEIAQRETTLPTKTPGEIRDAILRFETALSQLPNALFGDVFPLKHGFADGVYVREIFIPKGYILTGKIHKYAHPNFLMQGEVIVVTEHEGVQHLKAPLSLISQAGTKRAVIALEDTIWITVHVTNETDLDKIEEAIIAKNYATFDAFTFSKLLKESAV